MQEKIREIYLDQQTIARRIAELGAQITRDYAGKQPYMICILKGSIVFYADLIRAIDLPVHVDTMAVSSYGSSTISSGNVRVRQDLAEDIADKDVIVVEDIIDSGHTLSALTKMLRDRSPASLRVVTFLDKPSRRKVEFKGDYVGFEIPDEFVVGYGLDYAQKYRNLPYLGILELQED